MITLEVFKNDIVPGLVDKLTDGTYINNNVAEYDAQAVEQAVGHEVSGVTPPKR